uniref:Uncharacterized protein n=1 Tax=Anguilla anguilla TaxID=7936 RepID=A0A0E9QA22_ANGAN
MDSTQIGPSCFLKPTRIGCRKWSKI